jgi:RNA polymerase sigma-70 factor (ECF subfamily)
VTPLISHAIGRAQVGDGDAFEFLYARYADDVYAYVCGIVQDRHEAEDLTRRVFAELMRRVGSYEEQDTFLAWVMRLAREVAVGQAGFHLSFT